MAMHVYPVLGKLGIADIELAHVMSVLQPIWQQKTDTARRVRSRIETVLAWATTRGYRSGENPSRWRGHVENLLPRPSKVRRAEQFASLAYSKIGEFMAHLRQQDGLAQRALEFGILTATRTGEVLAAEWTEVHFAERLWVIPAERMKARREHRVPLSDTAVTLLQALPRQGDHVFQGAGGGRLGPKALHRALVLMQWPGTTVHGFRSTFSTWAAERTNYSFEVRELALAHSVGSQVERAYQRSDLFDRRRRLMQDWAEFCAAPAAASGEVVALRSAR
jgi:integrase